jgi:hypothetical protein
MTNELDKAVIVDFPLRGERWVAENSPGDRVPSHGTDMLGQRFAYDLLKVDARGPGLRYHPAGILRGFFIGVRTRDCYAWGAEIHAPFEGEIVAAGDGVSERGWIHPLRELIVALKNTVTFSPARLRSLLGNYVIMRGGDVLPLSPTWRLVRLRSRRARPYGTAMCSVASAIPATRPLRISTSS